MENDLDPPELLQLKFGEDGFSRQSTKDSIITIWMPAARIQEVLQYLKSGIPKPFVFLHDLTAIDERTRKKEPGYPSSHFTIVYHLFSFGRNSFLRLKVALAGDKPSVPSITSLWMNANWYEREVFDMFGIRF